jgi:hypothetical protein
MMPEEIEEVEEVADKIQDLIELLRCLYPNFNSLPDIDKAVRHLMKARNRLFDYQYPEVKE